MMIERVGDALAVACLLRFGSTWSNDTRREFAKVAIEAMQETDITTASGFYDWWKKHYNMADLAMGAAENAWEASADNERRRLEGRIALLEERIDKLSANFRVLAEGL